VNAAGKMLLVWTEGTGWARGGALAWQGFDRDGRPSPEQRGRRDGAIPVWGLAAAVAKWDGGFTVLH
jgi:hypothetical protein